jgi:hypothetical protein
MKRGGVSAGLPGQLLCAHIDERVEAEFCFDCLLDVLGRAHGMITFAGRCGAGSRS